MHILYFLTLLAFSIYSYVLVDPNFTLFNHPSWAVFRDYMVQLGYYKRPLSAFQYLLFLTVLCYFAWHFYHHEKKYKPLMIAVIVVLGVSISYPFLSHDLFNYMFDAKIVTTYGQNPYFKKPMDFSADPWLRFMHWTHRTYPYGPFFLVLSLIPSFFSLGKLLLSFFMFKGLMSISYLGMVWAIQKVNKKMAMLVATSPLIIIEGLVSAHNDIVGTSLAVIGIWLLITHKTWWGRAVMVLSAGIKYFTAPLLLVNKSEDIYSRMALVTCITLLSILTFYFEIQPWYFLIFFGFVFHYPALLRNLSILFVGLLLSYYPYMLAGWTETAVMQKHIIIGVAFLINMAYLFYQFRRKKAIFV